MPLSNSIASYEDLRKYLDQALESERGIKLTLGTRGKAIHFRQRVYKFRLLDRERSKAFYEATDPAWGTSPYDGLSVDVNENVIEIKKLTADEMRLTVEML